MKYNKDGSLAYTLVSPEDTQPFGLYYYDGSVRVVDASSDGGFGVYAKNGALRVDFLLTDKLYNETGALSLSVLSQRSVYLPIPTGLNWPQGDYPLRLRLGASTADLDPETLVNVAIWTGTAYYVDVVSGNDGNAGTSTETPVKSIKQAITLGNATSAAYRIYVKTGDYEQAYSINGTTGSVQPTQHCAIIAVDASWQRGTGARVRHFAGTSETFPATTNATYTNTFVGGPSSAIRVFDRLALDAHGSYTELTEVADAATCDATPNSWCVSSATGSAKTHIRRTDGLQPTLANTLICRNLNVARFNSHTKDILIEGFDFEGGPFGACWFDSIATRNIVLLDCTYKYAGREATRLDGLRVRRTNGIVYVRRGQAFANWKDGLNYHYDDGPVDGKMYVLQDHCSGGDNGRGTSTSNNSSTTHDDVVLVDFGGHYYPSYNGSTFHNIQQTKTWVVGSTIEASEISGPLTDPDVTNIACAVKIEGEAWLQNVTITSPAIGLFAQSSGTAVHTRNCTIGGTTEISSGAVVDSVWETVPAA